MDQPNKVAVVALADAVADPGAVVVQFLYAAATDHAVHGAEGPRDQALLAVF